jgi:chemotaxis response regulator CheB
LNLPFGEIFHVKIVVLLSDPSLLTQGIVLRLRHSFCGQEIETIDSHRPDLLEALIQVNPQVIILDVSNKSIAEICPLHRIFNALPNVILMEINLENSQIQVIRSDHYDAGGFTDLLQLIERVRANFSNTLNTFPPQ